MDLRHWFRQSDRPASEELFGAVSNFPCTDYRCPAVMRVFLEGARCGFRLTDDLGAPTPALWVMVNEMGVKLSQGGDIRPEEQRYFTKYRKMPADELASRWFISEMGDRLAANAMATMNYGWAWPFLPGLMCKNLTERMTTGEKFRWKRWLVMVKANWRLHDYVYRGLWVWTGSNPRKQWDAYGFLRESDTVGSAGGERLAGSVAVPAGTAAG